MIVIGFDFVTRKISRIEAPDDALCSTCFRRRLAVRPTVAIINIRARSGRPPQAPGLLSVTSPGTVYLCDVCLDTTGEAEKDAHADLMRGGATL